MDLLKIGFILDTNKKNMTDKKSVTYYYKWLYLSQYTYQDQWIFFVRQLNGLET